jgi:hypothetical protein
MTSIDNGTYNNNSENSGYNRNFKKGNNVNWNAIIRGPLLEDINQYKQRFDKDPTLRGCYYRLLSRGYFENTKSSYNNFVSATTIARWRRLSKVLNL